MIFSTATGTPGGRPALMAHCFLGHSGGWKRLLAALRSPLDARVFDLPGHGRSAPWDGLADPHDLSTAALAALIDRPRLLIGHSFGATLALRHALDHPATVTGLVLIEPVLFAAARGEPEFEPYMASEQPFREAILRGDWAAATECFFALNDDLDGWRALPAEARARMVAQLPMLAAAAPALLGDRVGLCAPGRLEGLDIPVLLLGGAETPPIFRAVLRVLARRLPQARMQLVAGAGHMAPITDPQPTAALIDDWLAQGVPQKEKPRAG